MSDCAKRVERSAHHFHQVEMRPESRPKKEDNPFVGECTCTGKQMLRCQQNNRGRQRAVIGADLLDSTAALWKLILIARRFDNSSINFDNIAIGEQICSTSILFYLCTGNYTSLIYNE